MEWTAERLEGAYNELGRSILVRAYNGENTPIQVGFGEEEPYIFKPKGGDANYLTFQNLLGNGNTYTLRFWDGSTFNVRLAPIAKRTVTEEIRRNAYQSDYKHYVVGTTSILNLSECRAAVKSSVRAFAQRVSTSHGAVLKQAEDWMYKALCDIFGRPSSSGETEVAPRGIIKYEQDDTSEYYKLQETSRFEFSKAGMANLPAFDTEIGFAEALSNTEKMKNGFTFPGYPYVYKWVLRVSDKGVRYSPSVIAPPSPAAPPVKQW